MTDRNHPTQELIRIALFNQKGDSQAEITNMAVEPLEGYGLTGNLIYRVVADWRSRDAQGQSRYVVKSWSADGYTKEVFDHDHPCEALASQAGIFDDLPEGISVPIVAAEYDPSGGHAMIVMENVADELERYSRLHPRNLSTATEECEQILNKLAEFHVHWEAPDHARRLAELSWLLPLEDVLWKDAIVYAHAIGEESTGGRAAGRVPRDNLDAILEQFLNWLPDASRDFWRCLLYDRRPLVTAMQRLPQTLLHGDLDDRNIGLPSSPAGLATEVLLIDWEFTGMGPPGLDVAKTLHQFMVQVEPQERSADRYFDTLEVLTDGYYARYQELGGDSNRADFEDGLYLGLLKEHLTPLPHITGELLLARAAHQAGVTIAHLTIDDLNAMLELIGRSYEYVTHKVAERM